MNVEFIKQRKKELGLTNKELAEMSGISVSALDKITSGINDNPTLVTAQLLAKTLKCTLDDFDDSPINSDDNMGFKERLRQARLNMGINQKQLSDIIGITPSALTNYEKGYSFPNTETLYRLFRALEVDPNFLFQDVCETNSDVIKTFSEFKNNFYALNRSGKLKLIDYSEVLLGNPKYKNEV